MFDGNRYTEIASRYCGLLPDRTEITALALLLELRALTKSVPCGRVLFRDLSLNVQPGELVSLSTAFRVGFVLPQTELVRSGLIPAISFDKLRAQPIFAFQLRGTRDVCSSFKSRNVFAGNTARSR